MISNYILLLRVLKTRMEKLIYESNVKSMTIIIKVSLALLKKIAY